MNPVRKIVSKPCRKWLDHSLPSWVEESPDYFVTLCCSRRGENLLCTESTGKLLLEAVGHYSCLGRWYVRLLLLMPDHLHAILCVPKEESLRKQIACFKRYTAGKTGVGWERGFFDHRLRNDESLEEKAHYIIMNPVRRGLVASPETWKWIYRADGV